MRFVDGCICTGASLDSCLVAKVATCCNRPVDCKVSWLLSSFLDCEFVMNWLPSCLCKSRLQHNFVYSVVCGIRLHVMIVSHCSAMLCSLNGIFLYDCCVQLLPVLSF